MPVKLSPVACTSAKLTFVLWCTVLAFIGPATIFTGQTANVHESLSLFWGALTGLILAAPLYLAFRAVQRLPSIPRAMLLGSALALTALTQSAADYAGQFVLRTLFTDVVMPPTDIRSLLLTLLIYLCIYSCNTAIFWITQTAQDAREQELELSRSQARVAWSEMERLRLQLNPHFMCNSLNSISGLITEGRHGEADDMAIRLADFLRASIEESSSEVTVTEEYATLEAYLDVEAMRFGARMTAELDCADEVSAALLPPFLLQPLIENAIQYAVSPTSKPVTVRVAARQEGGALLIEVTDTGDVVAHRRPSGPGRGIGLANIRARLAAYYGDTAFLETGPTDAGFRAAVRLPLTLREPATAVAEEAKVLA